MAFGPSIAAGRAASAADFDADGWPDIALARSGAPNVLFLSRSAQ